MLNQKNKEKEQEIEKVKVEMQTEFAVTIKELKSQFEDGISVKESLE